MRFNSRTWSLLSVLLFVAAIFFWLKGNDLEARRRLAASTNQVKNTAPFDLATSRATHFPLAQLNLNSSPSPRSTRVQPDPNHYRLRNTSRDLDDLVHEDKAILLANALFDTANLRNGGGVAIPAHLKSQGDPGSFIVQAAHAPDAAFRRALSEAGAKIISYVPNNAYFVQADQAAADKLAADPGVQTVLPFQPYYKIAPSLLKSAVDQTPLADGTLLRLTLIPGAHDVAIDDLRSLNAVVLSEESSPFGPQVVIQPDLASLDEIAQLASVQGIEPDHERIPANDLSRITLGVATNSFTNNYLNLTGSNILVNLNDIGIDTNYPGIKGRVTVGYGPMGGTDVDGHGTFVAGMIAGDGTDSPTDVQGSLTNANFRGIAPLANLFALPLDSGEDVYPKVEDSYLIETAARTNYLVLGKTNTLISNNSWTYPVQDYDSAAARYDAAVRDSIPGATNSQPLLFVFAAGNSGFGNEDGSGGQGNSIESPGTAKNVITVGALEQPRFITNFYVLTNVFTNTLGDLETNTATNFPFSAMTDSGNQVASFSSRGNVGAGFEGNFGRFKPDVVAPGTMIVSARSSGWNITNVVDTNTPLGQLYADLHKDLDPYRFDSGTTFAAANVSGMLALIQEYYETLAPTPMKGVLSPALMKALLVNGARPVNQQYDMAVRNTINLQGWGLPSLPAVFPSFSTNSHSSLDEKHWRLRFVEQSPTNALATGQSRTWNVTLSTNASGFPFRVTLVWTDPPGNPNVGIKLVNNLDLIVTNLDTGIVWYGNNFPVGNDFSEPSFPKEGDPVISDNVNNVENVSVARPFQFGRNFSITVAARRVNVNSVNDYLAATGNTNDVTQDFALVVASEMGEDSTLNSEDIDFREEEVFEKFEAPKQLDFLPRVGATTITNGLPLLAERVGANASLIGTNGVTNQWNFYVFTNVYIPNSLVNITNGSNVAFVTFDPPNLARPRNLEADIDLYVSTDSRLLDLNPAAVAASLKSVDRGGTELVVLTNATVGASSIYYVAVKSEDQQAAEFSLIGLSSDLPFDRDQNGQRLLTALPFSSFIPDGSASHPKASMMVAIGLADRRVRRVVITNTISHEDLGDLVGLLRHSSTTVVLNNHTLNNGNYIGTNTIVYNDYDPVPNEQIHTDGPGSLNDFAGEKITGAWIMEMIDSAPSHTGRVELLTLTIDPLQKPIIPGEALTATVDPNQTLFYPIDVPPGVTNLNFRFTDMTPGGVLQAFLRRDELPTTNIYEFSTNITAPGAIFDFPTTNNAPLTPGTYFLALRNPGAFPVTFTLTMLFSYSNDPNNEFHFKGAGPVVFDDATTNQILQIVSDKLVGSAEVAVRMDHPRVADTVLSLVSPQGTKILLSENRGQTNGLGFGAESGTNTAYAIFTDDTNYATLPIKFAPPPFTDISRTFAPVFTNGFEAATNGVYAKGQVLDGWTVTTNTVTVLADPGSAFEGTNFVLLGRFGAATNQISVSNGIPPIDGLVAYYPLNGDTLDGSINHLDGTNHNVIPGPDHLGNTNSAMFFNGANSYIDCGNPAQFNFSQSFTISAWVKLKGPQINRYIVAKYLDQGFGNRTSYSYGLATGTNSEAYGFVLGTGTVYYDIRGPVSLNDNKWHSIIYAYDQSYGLRMFVDGNPLSPLLAPGYPPFANNISLKIGSGGTGQFFGGLIDNVRIYTRPLDGIEAAKLYQAELNPVLEGGITRVLSLTQGKTYELRFVAANASSFNNTNGTSITGKAIIDGRTKSFVAGTNWTANSINFLARSNLTTITLQSDAIPAYVDQVEVYETGDKYYLPEESLSLLEGQRAIGQWKLELLDDKTGANVPLPELFSWKLNLIYADPLVLAEPLENNRTYPKTQNINQTNRITPGTLFTNQTHYFVVNTCPDTTEATVTLIGSNNVGEVEMLIDRSGIPTGNPETDDYVSLLNSFNPNNTRNGSATFRITTTSPASAPLEPGKPFFLAVRNRSVTSTNSYMINIHLDRSSCEIPQSTRLITSQPALFSMLAAAADPRDSAQGELYSVEVPSGAGTLSLNVQADSDLAILAKKGSPPSLLSYDYVHDTYNSGNETLTITSNSPISLGEGTWYYLVVNNSPLPATYRISATGDFSDNPDQPVLAIASVDSGVLLSWHADAGVQYALQSSTDLRNWTLVLSKVGNGADITYSATASQQAAFYRLLRE
jgi:subtilisin-like proprotein convertase family protein